MLHRKRNAVLSGMHRTLECTQLLESMAEQSVTVNTFREKRDKLLKLITAKDAKDFFTKLFFRAYPLDLDAAVMQELLQEYVCL